MILCLTGLGSLDARFIAAKLVGHKQIPPLEFFDSITEITIDSIAAEMPSEMEERWKSLAAILIYAWRC